MGSGENKKRIRNFILWVIVGTVIFVVGIFFSSFLSEKGYQLKEWVSRPFVSPPSLKAVKLCFTGPDGNYLSLEERKIILREEPNAQIKDVLKELIRGPENKDLSSTLPNETKVRAVYLKNQDICVDFSSSLSENHPGGSTGELLTVYSIVNTLLLNFPSYTRVQILIQGKPRETLAGHIDIRNPFILQPEMIR